MDRSRPRRAAALVLSAALLLLVAAPAAAAPVHRAVAREHNPVSWFDALSAWVIGLWPGWGATGGPTAAPQALGSVGDPNGAAAPSQGSGTSLGDGPTVQPQLGGYIDPYG